MNRRAVPFVLAVLGFMLAAPVNAQQPSPPVGPFVRSDATIKISDHVWIIPDNSVPGVPNVGFVVGQKATLVIDTGMGPPNGRTVLAEALKISNGKPLFLVTTHVHPEHDLGAQAFPEGTKLIRSNAQVAEIADQGMRTAEIFRARSETNRQLLDGAVFRKADITFDESYELDLGGVIVRLSAVGPAHTSGDTAIFLPADRVLFAGDLAMKALPAFASPSSSLKRWLASLAAFDALRPLIVVPSHGPTGDARLIADYRTYLVRIRDRTATLKADGKSSEQITAQISAELKADYADISRAAGAIRAAYNEAN